LPAVPAKKIEQLAGDCRDPGSCRGPVLSVQGCVYDPNTFTVTGERGAIDIT